VVSNNYNAINNNHAYAVPTRIKQIERLQNNNNNNITTVWGQRSNHNRDPVNIVVCEDCGRHNSLYIIVYYIVYHIIVMLMQWIAADGAAFSRSRAISPSPLRCSAQRPMTG